MPATTQAPYTNDFFSQYVDGSLSSARQTVPLLAEWFPIGSVLDVGCGTGAWLKAWSEHGVTDFFGIDGYSSDQEHLISGQHFATVDLSRGFDLGRRFDVVMSLEVAEHLDASAAQTLVDSICRHGDLVLFSAAVPNQGGVHHVNEQWPEYWVELFTRNGFTVFDLLRPRIWQNHQIEMWYRQNVLVFAAGEAARRASEVAPAPAPLAVVHPEYFLQPELNIKKLLAELRYAAGRRARDELAGLRRLSRRPRPRPGAA